MSEKIEFACQTCGAILKVPKQRGGQSGKCAHCGNTVSVPVKSSHPVKSNRRVPPKPRPIVSAETSEEFLSTDDFEEITASPPRTITIKDSLPSSRSSKSGLASSPKPRKTPAAKPRKTPPLAKPRTTPPPYEEQDIMSSHRLPPGKAKDLFFSLGKSPLFCLILGLALGIVIGIIIGKGLSSSSPETKEENVPPLEEIEVSSYEPDKNSTEDLSKSKNPPIIDNSQEKEKLEAQKRKAYQALGKVRSYSNTLNSRYNELNNNLDILIEKYRYPIPAHLISLEEQSKRKKDFVKKQGEKIRLQMQSPNVNWNEVYNNLKPLMLDPNKSSIIQSLVQAIDETSGLIDQYSKSIEERSSQKKNLAGYMGNWYPQLLKLLGTVEKYSQKNVRIPTTGASVKLQEIQKEIGKIRRYEEEIGQIAQELENHVAAGNNLENWIRQEIAEAQIRSQERKARLLENFWNQGHRFRLNIKEEYEELRNATKVFAAEVSRKQIEEDTIRKMLAPIQAITRKYDRQYQDFNSAVANFTSL